MHLHKCLTFGVHIRRGFLLFHAYGAKFTSFSEKARQKLQIRGQARAFHMQKLLRRFSRGKRPAAIKGAAFKIRQLSRKSCAKTSNKRTGESVPYTKAFAGLFSKSLRKAAPAYKRLVSFSLSITSSKPVRAANAANCAALASRVMRRLFVIGRG